MSISLLSMSTLEDSVPRKGNAMFFGTILPASQLPSLLPSFTAFRFVLSAPRCRIQGGEWERHSVLSLYKFFWIGPSRSFVHLQTPPSSVCFWTFTLPHQILLKTCKHIGVKGGYIVKHGADRGCVVLCLRSFLWNTGTLPHFAIGHGNTSYLVSSLSCCMIENTSVIKTFRLQRAVELVSIVPEFLLSIWISYLGLPCVQDMRQFSTAHLVQLVIMLFSPSLPSVMNWAIAGRNLTLKCQPTDGDNNTGLRCF